MDSENRCGITTFPENSWQKSWIRFGKEQQPCRKVKSFTLFFFFIYLFPFCVKLYITGFTALLLLTWKLSKSLSELWITHSWIHVFLSSHSSYLVFSLQPSGSSFSLRHSVSIFNVRVKAFFTSFFFFFPEYQQLNHTYLVPLHFYGSCT